MGIDIHSYVEVCLDGRWDLAERGWSPFDWRDYGLYGFLANVRNYSHVPVISEPRGLPDDVSSKLRRHYEDADGFGASWLTLAELLAFDYDRVFWNRRITREIAPGQFDGAALAQEGEGEHVTVRHFLGAHFFADLDRLATLGPPDGVRILFWFS